MFMADGTDYRVRVTANEPSSEHPFSRTIVDDSDADFTITSNGKIAYSASAEGSMSSDVFLVDENGTKRLTSDPAYDNNPAISPLWDKVAFSSRRDGNYEIYVVNVDGPGLRRLTSNTADDEEPSWSPDGRKIVFYSKRSGYYDLYAVNVDGSHLTALTSTNAPDWDPNWSPRRPLRSVRPPVTMKIKR